MTLGDEAVQNGDINWSLISWDGDNEEFGPATVGFMMAKAGNKDLFTGGATPSVFAGYPYDVYAQDGGVFATTLWNDIVDARRNRALSEEAARKALKPVSRKAMKNAARKAARR